MNCRTRLPAEIMVKYVDKKLRGEKGLNDAEVEAQLDRVSGNESVWVRQVKFYVNLENKI